MSIETIEIAYPEVRIRNGHKREYKKLIDNFFTNYNKGKRSREQLKAPHKQLLLELVFYAHIVVERDSKLLREEGLTEIKPGSYIKVDLNRFVLANEIRRSPDTIKRYKKRLADAGAILVKQEDFDKQNINKGGRNKVLINPDLMLIYDRFNPEFQPTSPYLSETEIQALHAKKSANCIPVSGTVTIPDQINNQIIDVDNVDKGVKQELDNLQRVKEKIQEATPKLNAGGDEIQEHSPENSGKSAKTHGEEGQKQEQKSSARNSAPVDNSTAPQKRDKLADLKRMFAIELYALMVRFLFRNHNVYPGEEKNTIRYIQDKYFSTIRNEEHGYFLLKGEYTWRVNAAANYIRKKKEEDPEYTFENVYPSHYVDVENKKGFVGTKPWWIEHQKREEIKKKNRIVNNQKLLEKQLLSEAIERVQENPTTSTFKQTLEEVQAKIPYLSDQFLKAVSEQQLGS